MDRLNTTDNHEGFTEGYLVYVHYLVALAANQTRLKMTDRSSDFMLISNNPENITFPVPET